eukprot:1131129-Ditylum_brightwellii.AAC.1
MGNIIIKDRVSHDLSFPKEKLAINNRVCHYIHNLHFFYPHTRILMHKCDIENAYCHLHTQGCIVAACIADVKNIAVALLRLLI